MVAPTLVVRDGDLLPADSPVAVVGGKSLGLHRLRGLGATVPRWATLTSQLFGRICDNDRELQELLAMAQPDPLPKAAQVRERLQKMPIDSAIQEEMIRVWKEISDDGRVPAAVRSSAVDEDSRLLSFAGQMDSFLNVTSEARFLEAVRLCWGSLFGDRAVQYRIQNGVDPWTPRIAVVVQQLVAAEVSGVVFTANPLTGNRQEMMVSSTWGLGEGLVSGALDADTFILDTAGRTLSVSLADKGERILPAGSGGTETIGVAEELRGIATLDNGQLLELHRLATKVQDDAGMPMDIEFALAAGVIYLLQARPITSLMAHEQADGGNFIIWDNSNIVESYSGVTTPLTFSFIRKAYSAVYWQFWETLGVSRNTIMANRHILENMLGLIQGRVYYNLLNWYRLISMMPGFSYNKKFMEQMMGLQVSGDFTPETERAGAFERYVVQLPRLAWVGLKMILAHMTLPRRIAEFHDHFNAIYGRYANLDFSRIPPAEILACYRVLENEILWKWKAPITNDFEAMIFYGLLKKLTTSWQLDEDGTLQNDLLCGEGGIRSTLVTTDLFRIARMIAASDDLKAAFLEGSPEAALHRLRTDEAFAAVNREFDRYLEEYGVRSIEEMKLESIPIRDNPLFCIAMLRNYLASGVPDPDHQREHEQSIRQSAEQRLQEKLVEGYPRSWRFKSTLYNWILRNARNAVKNRENQRFARAEAYNLVRSMVRAIGGTWQQRGILADAGDIFYLELEEIWSFIQGTSTCTNLGELVSLRKKEFEAYRTMEPDDHIETRDEVYAGNLFSNRGAVSGESGLLHGLGCCRGTVERAVQVVFRPDVDLKLNGEIMVAKQTDPGWVVLFPSVSGLIVEKGSMLSHSAIVAREMGIPAVVGVKDATRILRTGDTVRLDGAAGTVEILQRAEG